MAPQGSGNNQLFDLNIMAYYTGLSDAQKYYFMPRHGNNIAMDVPAGNMANGTSLQIWEKMPNNANQGWKLTYEKNYVLIRSVINDQKYLDVAAYSMDNGASVQLWDGVPEGRNQEWLIFNIPRDNTKYIIFNRNSGKCLDVYGVSNVNGTKLVQWEFVNGNNQKWEIRSF